MSGSLRRFAVAAGVTFAVVGGMPWLHAGADPSGTVELQTVPALPGVLLDVGGDQVRTAQDGSASLPVADVNGIAQTVHLARRWVSPTIRVSLARVAVLPHTVARLSRLEIGLAVSYRVRIRIDPGNTGVAAASISAIRLHSSLGTILHVDPRSARRAWLLARQARLQHNALTVQRITWSVDSVTAARGVAITSAEPRFDPSRMRAWTLRLRPVAGIVHLRTVPAVAGVEFLLDGAVVTTGSDGSATTLTADLNDVNKRLTLSSAVVPVGTVALVKVTRAPPRAAHERELVVALSVSRPVRMQFVDPAGEPIAAERVAAVRLRADGVIEHLRGSRIRHPVLLRSARAELVGNVWRVRTMSYSMASAAIDGGEAVFAGQQQFRPAVAGVWQIRLAVFRVTVTAHDALFGTRVASSVVVTRPDGAQYERHVGSGGVPATLESVVRGDYRLRFTAAVIGSTTPVRISRDDHIDVRVITLTDVLAIATVVALLAGSALYGALRVARYDAGRS